MESNHLVVRETGNKICLSNLYKYGFLCALDGIFAICTISTISGFPQHHFWLVFCLIQPFIWFFSLFSNLFNQFLDIFINKFDQLFVIFRNLLDHLGPFFGNLFNHFFTSNFFNQLFVILRHLFDQYLAFWAITSTSFWSSSAIHLTNFGAFFSNLFDCFFIK